MVRSKRARLHARAAWGLAASAAGRLEEVAGVLGHHFAVAGETGLAVHYLEMAGDRAARAFASDEAVQSYCYGLGLLARARIRRPGAWPRRCGQGRDREIRLKLAYVFLLTGRRSDAEETLEEGLRACSVPTMRFNQLFSITSSDG